MATFLVRLMLSLNGICDISLPYTPAVFLPWEIKLHGIKETTQISACTMWFNKIIVFIALFIAIWANWPIYPVGWSSKTSNSAWLKYYLQKTTGHLFLIQFFAVFGTKLRHSKWNISALSDIIWLLGVNIAFSSVMNNSTGKQRIFFLRCPGIMISYSLSYSVLRCVVNVHDALVSEWRGVVKDITAERVIIH